MGAHRWSSGLIGAIGAGYCGMGLICGMGTDT